MLAYAAGAAGMVATAVLVGDATHAIRALVVTVGALVGGGVS